LLLLFVRLQRTFSLLLFVRLHLLSTPISRPCNISSLHSYFAPLQHILSPPLFRAPAPSLHSYFAPLQRTFSQRVCGLSACGTQPADSPHRRTAQRWAVRNTCTTDLLNFISRITANRAVVN